MGWVGSLGLVHANYYFFLLSGLHVWHMEVPRLQMLAYATAIGMPDLRHVCNLHPSSRQHQILNPLSRARDRIHNLVVSSRIHFRCATTGTPKTSKLLSCSYSFSNFKINSSEFPSWLSRVSSLALIHGLKIWRCRELWCRSKTRLRSLVAVALA